MLVGVLLGYLIPGIPAALSGLRVGTNLRGLNTETTKQPAPYTAVTERFVILERVTALAAICM